MVILVSGATGTHRRFWGSPHFGHLVTPRNGDPVKMLRASGRHWAADNDCFQGLDKGRFFKMLGKIADQPGCLFVACPDIVADARATLDLFATWEPVIRAAGLPVALVVQNESTARELYSRAARCLFHENLLPIAKKMLTGRELEPDTPDVERAYWYLVFSWMGLNGISGTPLHHTGTFAVRYSGNGGNGATRWASVCDSIPDWHQRLIGVQILSRDAFALIERIEDQSGTAIYVDPPYFTKGARYVHDFIREDHDRLAVLLRRFKACRVVISYYAHPALAELYPGWTTVDSSKLRIAKSMVNSGKRGNEGRTEAPELLLLNGPSYAFAGDDSPLLF